MALSLGQRRVDYNDDIPDGMSNPSSSVVPSSSSGSSSSKHHHRKHRRGSAADGSESGHHHKHRHSTDGKRSRDGFRERSRSSRGDRDRERDTYDIYGGYPGLDVQPPPSSASASFVGYPTSDRERDLNEPPPSRRRETSPPPVSSSLTRTTRPRSPDSPTQYYSRLEPLTSDSIWRAQQNPKFGDGQGNNDGKGINGSGSRRQFPDQY